MHCQMAPWQERWWHGSVPGCLGQKSTPQGGHCSINSSRTTMITHVTGCVILPAALVVTALRLAVCSSCRAAVRAGCGTVFTLQLWHWCELLCMTVNPWDGHSPVAKITNSSCSWHSMPLAGGVICHKQNSHAYANPCLCQLRLSNSFVSV